MSAAPNGDGVVNLKSEMNYAHAYYASAFDKGSVTDYYNTITRFHRWPSDNRGC